MATISELRNPEVTLQHTSFFYGTIQIVELWKHWSEETINEKVKDFQRAGFTGLELIFENQILIAFDGYML